MAISPENVINQALRRVSNEPPIGFIYEGSRAARAALDIYAQTRDDLLGDQHWPFARRDVALTLLKTAPVNGYAATPWTSAYPPPPWVYEYLYPSDCIEIRGIRSTPIFIPSFDPTPNLWVLSNDNALNPPQKVVLTNVASAIAVYTGQVTDLNLWDSNSIEALIEAIGRRLAEALSTDPNLFKQNAMEEVESQKLAISARG